MVNAIKGKTERKVIGKKAKRVSSEIKERGKQRQGNV